MNIKVRNLAHAIYSENDSNRLYKLLSLRKEFVRDNLQGLLDILSISDIGKTFCILPEADIKFICMNTHDPSLLKYVPKEYCSNILKLFKNITSRYELMRMYVRVYGDIQDNQLRKHIFDIIVKNFTVDLVYDIESSAVDTMTNDEFMILYNKYGKEIKRKCKLSNIYDICCRFEKLFSDTDSKLFYRELIKDNNLTKQISECSSQLPTTLKGSGL